ncbi:prepilin peptidase [Serratia quinivorans]|uniref:prepilin peptidase n=1 Tax=Serratia quinivorans TaxID=137545 RepID=UPI00217870F7|nr:A24 family peptidase [Serratia quinivorans]CAI1688268.1 Pectic enzymes secretion protein outO [Serratia quinivorans]CAI1769678.1 Pectic enzymes secretion protein outO [Serratia quinivorans]
MFDNPQLDFWFRGLFIPAMLLPAALATRLIGILSPGLTQHPLPRERTVMLIAVSAGLAALPFNIPLLQRLLLLPAAAILLALALIDWQQRLLPDRLTQPLLWAGLLVNQQGYFVSLTEAVTGACIGYLSLWLLNVAYRRRRKMDGIGQGDFKLLAALGAWTGWAALPMLVSGAAAAGLCATAIARLLRKPGRQDTLPFGLYLALSGWLVLLATADSGPSSFSGEITAFHLISP